MSTPAPTLKAIGLLTAACLLAACGGSDDPPRTEAERIAAAKSMTQEARSLIRNAEELADPAQLAADDYGMLIEAMDSGGSGAGGKSHLQTGLDEFGSALEFAGNFYDERKTAGEPGEYESVYNNIKATVTIGAANQNDRVVLKGPLTAGGSVDLNIDYPANAADDTRQSLSGNLNGNLNIENDGSHTDPDLLLSFNTVRLTLNKRSAEALGAEPDESAIDSVKLEGSMSLQLSANDGSGREVTYSASHTMEVVRCNSCNSQNESVFNPSRVDLSLGVSTGGGEEVGSTISYALSNARSFDNTAEVSSTNFPAASLSFGGLLNLPEHGRVAGSITLSSNGFDDVAQAPNGSIELRFSLDQNEFVITLRRQTGGSPSMSIAHGGVVLELRQSEGQYDGEILVDGEKVADIDTGAGDTIIIRYIDNSIESLG